MTTAGARGTVEIRYLGGPTATIEIAGLTLLTDPTFDPPGDYLISARTLAKTIGPAIGPEELGPVDAVLLSHDQHPDNLDRLGREYLATIPLVLSTEAAHTRLGGTVRALPAWESIEVPGPHHGASIRVTAVPARHGPPGCEPLTGDVTGFVLTGEGLPSVYVSGDNASIGHVRSVAERFGPIDIAVLFAGAARTPLLDGAALTLTSMQAAQAASILQARDVVPLHFEGWEHFSEGRTALRDAFAITGLADRLHLPGFGETIAL